MRHYLFEFWSQWTIDNGSVATLSRVSLVSLCPPPPRSRRLLCSPHPSQFPQIRPWYKVMCTAAGRNANVKTPTSTSNAAETIELAPSYTLPLVLTIGAIGLLVVQVWVAGVIALFGLFLLVQTAMIRLRFTPTALDVYRSDKLIRTFPYCDWQNWRIFWPPVPILFYFKEIRSIHFLPVLFDPKMLRTCLERYYPLSDG